MTHELRQQVVAPTSTYVSSLLIAGGCGLLGALLFCEARDDGRVLAPVTIENAPPVVIEMPMPVARAMEDAPPVAASKAVSLVFRAGGATYMKLASVGVHDHHEVMPRHGTATLHNDDYVFAAVATVKDADLDPELASWRGKRVRVGGNLERCEASVIGFAVVSRLTGDPGYAGIEGDETAWTAATVMEHGTPVLAAKLDGCAKGVYARDAALPAIVETYELRREHVATAAIKALKRSPEVDVAQDEWSEAGQTGRWIDDKYTEISAKVVNHPTTNTEWVSVQAHYAGGCGLPDLNLWKLYRVEADGSLTATTTALGELVTVEDLVDIDGDGELEAIGKPWLAVDRMIVDKAGETLDSLGLSFHGCGC